MFTKQDAIAYIKNIQSGGFDRTEIQIPMGKIAADVWESSKFQYGMENGAILALMVAFDISLDDLGYPSDYQPRHPSPTVPKAYQETP